MSTFVLLPGHARRRPERNVPATDPQTDAVGIRDETDRTAKKAEPPKLPTSSDGGPGA